MSEAATTSEIKQVFADTGEFYVGASPWPTGARYVLVVGSRYTKLHPHTTSQYLEGVLGVSVLPIPRDEKRAPNVYYYVVDLDAGANLSAIEDLEDGDVVVVAAVFAHRLMSEPQSLWLAKHLMAGAKHRPEYVSRKATLPKSSWWWLQINYVGHPAQPPGVVVEMLKSGGFRAINPISGASGFLSGTIWREDYVGRDYVNVLVNPGDREGVTTEDLQAEVFDALGHYGEGTPYALAWVFTTPELMANQGWGDSLEATKQLESSVAGVGAGAFGAVKSALDVLGASLKTVPYLIYAAVGAGAAILGWTGYKYVSRERAEWRMR